MVAGGVDGGSLLLLSSCFQHCVMVGGRTNCKVVCL